MKKITIFASESAEKTEVDSTLSIIATLLLAVEGNDTKAAGVDEDFKVWLKQSAAFAKSLGIYTELATLSKIYLTKGTVDDQGSRDLGEVLKQAKPLVKDDFTVSKPQLAYYNDLVVCLANPEKADREESNNTPWKRVNKNIHILKSPKLAHICAPDEITEIPDEIASSITKAKKLMKQLVGDGTSAFLHPKDRTELIKDPSKQDLLLQYNALMKPVNATIKPAIAAYVRNSKESLVSIDVMRADFDRIGQPHNLPVGFVGGQIDEKGKMYTKEGLQLDKEPFGKVVMNANYDPETNNTYVLRSARVHNSRYRTIEMNVANKKARHLKVQDFFDNEVANRAKWVNVLKTASDRTQVLAAMIELMYQTSARIGGKDNSTKGEPTYGLTTLQVRHTKILPKEIEFNYSGKMSHEQELHYPTIKAEAKIVRQILTSLVKGKGPDDLVFTWNNKPITDAMARAFLTSLGINVSPHKFRHLAGTKMAMAILKTLPFKKADKPSQAAVEKWIKEAFLPIGAHLHHATGTGKIVSSTALKSYIDPELVANVFTDLGLRRPNFIPA